MSKTLQFTENGWKEELASSGLPENTQELLSKAIRATAIKNYPFPKVSREEFNNIVDNQVLFIRLGSKGFILDKKGKKNNFQLVLQEEKDD